MANTSVFNSQGNVAQYARKNLLINGGFDVWQRGTSFVDQGAVYTADRWKLLSGGLNGVTRETDVPTGSTAAYSMQITNTGFPQIGQPVELPATGAAGVFKLGDTLTLSFWAKTTVGQAITAQAEFKDASAGSTNDVSIYIVTAGTGTGNWEKIVHTFTIGVTPNPTNTLANFRLYTNNGATLNLAQVQLELGDTATDFEYRPIGEELALCQRYYYTSAPAESLNVRSHQTIGTAFNTANIDTAYIDFPVAMRTSPTLVFHVTDGGGGANTWGFYLNPSWYSANVSGDAIKVNGFKGRMSSPATPVVTFESYLVNGNFTADAEL
jgi:hypothetical protein